MSYLNFTEEFSDLEAQHGGVRVSSLSGDDISHATLDNVWFRPQDIDLSYVKAVDARFYNQDLSQADLGSANLGDIVMRQCVLGKTNFSKSDLTGGYFDKIIWDRWHAAPVVPNFQEAISRDTVFPEDFYPITVALAHKDFWEKSAHVHSGQADALAQDYQKQPTDALVQRHRYVWQKYNYARHMHGVYHQKLTQHGT